MLWGGYAQKKAAKVALSLASVLFILTMLFIGGHQKASCAEGHPSKSPGCQQRRLVGLQALLQVQQAVGGLRQGADRLETSSRLLVAKYTEYCQSRAQLN